MKNTLTVAQLRLEAKSANIKGYSTMNKAQLEKAICDSYNATSVNQADTRANDESDLIIDEEVNVLMNYEPSNKTISMFDIKRYASFKLYDNLRTFAPTVNQLNLVKSLENNFKVSISLKGISNRGQLSDKLNNVYQAILSGKVSYRSEAEIEARVKAYKATESNLATKPQLEMITKLEKELGITVTTVISSKLVANQVIQELLSQKRSLIKSEVAVTTPIEEKPACFGHYFENNTSFRTKFTSMMKAMFNK